MQYSFMEEIDMKMYKLEELKEFINANSDSKYGKFHSKLTKSNYPINGIPIPVLRKYAKTIAKEYDLSEFYSYEPYCYEQVMLKGLTLTQLKLSDDKFFPLLESYIKEIDDWALTDVPCSNIKRKDDAYLQKVRQYAASEDVWFARWGIVAVMCNFYDDEKTVNYIVDNLTAEGYYVDMALAWLIQVLAVKNMSVAEQLMRSDKITSVVKKFAERKIKDSFRISKEDKARFCQILKEK